MYVLTAKTPFGENDENRLVCWQNLQSFISSSSSSDCCAGQRSTPHSRTLEVRPGRITKKLGLRYDCDCERDETKSLLGVLMLGCDILIANDE